MNRHINVACTIRYLTHGPGRLFDYIGAKADFE
jgi:hypothetical protein